MFRWLVLPKFLVSDGDEHHPEEVLTQNPSFHAPRRFIKPHTAQPTARRAAGHRTRAASKFGFRVSFPFILGRLSLSCARQREVLGSALALRSVGYEPEALAPAPQDESKRSRSKIVSLGDIGIRHGKPTLWHGKPALWHGKPTLWHGVSMLRRVSALREFGRGIFPYEPLFTAKGRWSTETGGNATPQG